MSLPQPGTHCAKLAGPIVIYETEKGALCAALPVKLFGEVAWTGKHTMTLAKSDGTIQEKTIQTLKQVFGWDGQDPFWLSDTDLTGADFEVVGEHEEYQPPDGEAKMVFKIQWLNPIGGTGAKMPTPADRKSVAAKYGAKLRALSGKPVTPTPKPATPKAAQPELPKPPTKPAPVAPPSGPPATMEETWQSLIKSNPGKTEQELGIRWWETMEAMFPGKNNSQLTPVEWGQLKAAFESA